MIGCIDSIVAFLISSIFISGITSTGNHLALIEAIIDDKSSRPVELIGLMEFDKNAFNDAIQWKQCYKCIALKI